MAIHPADGPAPTPNPHRAADRDSSPIPCAAAVHPPPGFVVPVTIPSPPRRQPPAKGGVWAHRPTRPWLDQTPPGRDAKEPETSAVSVGEAYWRVGENAAVLKAFPPDVSGPTVSVTYRTLPMPMPRDARV